MKWRLICWRTSICSEARETPTGLSSEITRIRAKRIPGTWKESIINHLVMNMLTEIENRAHILLLYSLYTVMNITITSSWLLSYTGNISELFKQPITNDQCCINCSWHCPLFKYNQDWWIWMKSYILITVKKNGIQMKNLTLIFREMQTSLRSCHFSQINY